MQTQLYNNTMEQHAWDRSNKGLMFAQLSQFPKHVIF